MRISRTLRHLYHIPLMLLIVISALARGLAFAQAGYPPRTDTYHHDHRAV